MATWSPEPWHLGGTVGATTLNRDIDVPDEPQWGAPVAARKMIDPCGLPPTLIYATGDSGPWEQIRLTIVVAHDDDFAATETDLLAVRDLRGPWSLTNAQGRTRSVVFDPTGGDWSRQNRGAFELWTAAFQQVG